MRLFSRAALASAVAILANCAAAPSVDLQFTRLAGGPAPFEINSGFTAPANIIVRDQAAWEDLWNTIYAARSPRPALPVVDFGKYMLVARAMGQRPTGGFNVVITGLLRQSGDYIVHVRETAPGPRCGVTQAVTSPIDIARIARHDDAMTFAIATETKDCVQ